MRGLMEELAAETVMLRKELEKQLGLITTLSTMPRPNRMRAEEYLINQAVGLQVALAASPSDWLERKIAELLAPSEAMAVRYRQEIAALREELAAETARRQALERRVNELIKELDALAAILLKAISRMEPPWWREINRDMYDPAATLAARDARLRAEGRKAGLRDAIEYLHAIPVHRTAAMSLRRMAEEAGNA